MADANSRVYRYIAAATHVHVVIGRIVLLDACPAAPRHQRVPFIAQTKRNGQLLRNLPAILKVPAELPLTAGHQNILLALLRRRKGRAGTARKR